jgi:hypothetical protein
MAIIAPPQPPRRVTFADGDGLRRVRFRLWQVLISSITIFATTWVCIHYRTFGIVWAILALMVAKHVLVAILVMGLEKPSTQRGRDAH